MNRGPLLLDGLKVRGRGRGWSAGLCLFKALRDAWHLSPYLLRLASSLSPSFLVMPTQLPPTQVRALGYLDEYHFFQDDGGLRCQPGP